MEVGTRVRLTEEAQQIIKDYPFGEFAYAVQSLNRLLGKNHWVLVGETSQGAMLDSSAIKRGSSFKRPVFPTKYLI